VTPRRAPGSGGWGPQPAIDAIEDVVATVLFTLTAAVATIGVAVLAGAQLAAALFGNGPFAAGLSDGIDATVALPTTMSAPAGAWPEPARSHLPGPVPYWGCTLCVLTIAGAAVFVGLRWWGARRHRGPFGVGEGGLARAADTRPLVVRRPTAGRLTLGLHGRRLLAAEPQTSLAVVGPTGCGKTVGFAIPALLEWRGPVVATSVKTDLLDRTLQHRSRLGRVWVYDPTSCTGVTPSQWSPLSACGDWTGAMRVATWLCEAAQPRSDTVTDGDYWYSQARKGLAPYLYAAAASGASMADVVRWVDEQDEDEVTAALVDTAGIDTQLAALEREGRPAALRELYAEEVRNEMVADMRDRYHDPTGTRGNRWVQQEPTLWPKPVLDQLQRETDREIDRRVGAQVRAEARGRRQSDGPPIRELISAQALWGKEKRLKGSVFATMENVLAGYADPGVAEAASGTNLDIDEWLAGDNTIYVVATAHEQARLRPVLTVLVQQAIRAAYDRANRRGGTLEHPCLALLDEAGNIAPLRDLPGYASTARSHGITFVSIWQDLAQIKSIYGERAQTVLNNHRAKLFGAGIADDPTLEYVSRLIGDTRRTEINRSGDLHGPRRSVSEHTSWRRLAPVDAIRRLRTGHGILLYGSIPPVWLRLRATVLHDPISSVL
jgi:type IV secretion system protein VirD4